MSIVDLPNLEAFSNLQDLLRARMMPGYRQIVSAQAGLLGDDEVAWLAENGVELRVGTLVPEGKIFVFREATGE